MGCGCLSFYIGRARGGPTAPTALQTHGTSASDRVLVTIRSGDRSSTAALAWFCARPQGYAYQVVYESVMTHTGLLPRPGFAASSLFGFVVLGLPEGMLGAAWPILRADGVRVHVHGDVR